MIYEINWSLDGVLPFHYISDIDFFQNNNKVEFKTGLNVLVGDNGCGKSTLVNIIKYYFLEKHGNVPEFNSEEYDHLDFNKQYKYPNGVNVIASYSTPTISMNNPAEADKSQRMSLLTIEHRLNHVSQGENTMREYNRCVSTLYDNNKAYQHPYSLLRKYIRDDWYLMPSIKKWYETNDRQDRITCMIMDEPDNSVSISNILRFQRELDQLVKNCSEGMQVIMVLHNPILLMHFLDNPKVNFIEMSENYLEHIKAIKRSLTKNS